MYDPKKIAVNWGNILILGFAKGTFVKIERAEDAFTDDVGSDGEVARARNNNQSGEIEITLMQASQSNDAISAQANADELTATAVAPFLVKDLYGTTLFHAPLAWVKKRAVIEFGKEQGDRTWVFRYDRDVAVVGGQTTTP